MSIALFLSLSLALSLCLFFFRGWELGEQKPAPGPEAIPPRANCLSALRGCFSCLTYYTSLYLAGLSGKFSSRRASNPGP